MKNFQIYPSITGQDNDWQSKLEEINQLKLTEAAVFFRAF